MFRAPKIPFTPDAEAMMEQIPRFVRPIVRRRAAQIASERGLATVTAELLEELKNKEMPR